jgi:3-oxoacyl-(acyl-carrier-protein) synthase
LKERDASEAAAIRAVFGPRVGELPVLATKGGQGNNGAGSGALDFIAAVLAVHHGTLPPAVNAAPLDPAAGLKLNTSGKATDLRVEAAVSAAYALSGGQNAALVVKRYKSD